MEVLDKNQSGVEPFSVMVVQWVLVPTTAVDPLVNVTLETGLSTHEPAAMLNSNDGHDIALPSTLMYGVHTLPKEVLISDLQVASHVGSGSNIAQ
jgi:hypothetical protein